MSLAIAFGHTLHEKLQLFALCPEGNFKLRSAQKVSQQKSRMDAAF
jgi:hypothetical protein